MPSASTDPAADTNAASGGTGLQNTASTSAKDPETAQRIALLEHFIAFSIASGITSLGVLLEILHLADYDLSRATRIAELVKHSPPEGPALITQSGNIRASNVGVGTATDSASSSQQDRYWNSIGSVQASVGEYTCSAAAASQYSVAVVGCGPNSAGVAVGTSAGTTTSTAVPFSAVTSLPSNTNIRVTTAAGAQVGVTASPNDGLAPTDQNSNSNQSQNQILQQQSGAPNKNASIYGTPSGVPNGTFVSAPNATIPKSTTPAVQQATGIPGAAATSADMAHTRVTSDMRSSPSYHPPNVSVLPPTAPSTGKTHMQTQSQAHLDDTNGHGNETSQTGFATLVTDATPSTAAPASADMGVDSGLGVNRVSKLLPDVNPQMKLEDLFQYLKA